MDDDTTNHGREEIVQLLQTYINSNSSVDASDVTRMMQEPPSGGERLYAIATPFIFIIGEYFIWTYMYLPIYLS